jgi:hypothetical protein
LGFGHLSSVICHLPFCPPHQTLDFLRAFDFFDFRFRPKSQPTQSARGRAASHNAFTPANPLPLTSHQFLAHAPLKIELNISNQTANHLANL